MSRGSGRISLSAGRTRSDERGIKSSFTLSIRVRTALERSGRGIATQAREVLEAWATAQGAQGPEPAIVPHRAVSDAKEVLMRVDVELVALRRIVNKALRVLRTHVPIPNDEAEGP